MIRERYSLGALRVFGGICLLALILLEPSCLAKYTRSGGIEPEYKSVEGKKYEVLGEASGESSSFNLFWLIPVTPRDRLNEAIENAISERGGDNIIDIQWWFERKYLVLGTVNIIHVQGKVIRYHNE